ncbi:leucine-rich repeat domain-containing protein [Capnocytophaga canimorsus]|nr:leucine-rich repeat domain-containing protein [Capnocytophaga canimorsus]
MNKMRKIGLILGLLCFGLVAMVSCNKDDNKQVEVPAKEIKIGKDAVNVLVGETQVIDITDGNGAYKVKSSDENKAVASVKGEKQIAVEGKSAGEVTLTITDSKQKQVSVKVNVFQSIALETKAIILKKGAEKSIAINSGSGAYKVESKDEAIATAKIVGTNSIVVSAVSKGNTTIVVTDTQTNKTEEISVIISELTLQKENIQLKINDSENVTITGSGEYSISSSKEGVIKAEIINNELRITAVASGEVVVTITDNQTSENKEITIVVMEELRMEKSELTVTNGDFEIINILGGDNANGNYEFEITATPADVVNVEPQWYDATQGHHLKVTGLKPGETTVTVKDKQTQQVTTFKVTVNLSEFSIPRTTLELSAGTSTTINIKGNGKYEVSSANSSIATAEESNGVLTITAVGSGSTEITVKDVLKDETKIVSVVVKSSFTVDTNGVLTAVEPSAIVANLVIPENVKEIKQDLFSRNAVLVSVTMKSVEVVQENAFYFIRTLTSVTFGNKIREIKADAFKFCTGLKSVKVEATTPPTLGNKTSTFRKIPDAVLKVPTGTKAAYEASDWKEYFTNIVEE